MGSPFNVVYLGGKQAGCVGLLSLYGAGCHVLGVVAYDTYVTKLAAALGLPSFGSIREKRVRELLKISHLMACVHGREVVPKELLDLPRYGGINVHPCLSLYKGADPIQRLLQAGASRASVGVHRMNERVDEGEVLVEEFVALSGQRSVEEVYNILYPLYALVLLKALCQMRQAG